jgi:Resolvase, N terminal domain
MGKDATHHRRRYNQPLAGVMANAGACLRWLDRENPDLDAVRRSVEWVVDDGDRASEVVRRIRGARDAIYLRVSTDTQTTANQRREPEDVAARSGWQIVEVYEIAGISGAKGRDKRPGLNALLKAVNAKNPTSSRLGPSIASGAPSQIGCCRHDKRCGSLPTSARTRYVDHRPQGDVPVGRSLRRVRARYHP